ncbi:MAG: hypothetical protein B0D92_08585 [Spirochaeta sp. LUC14_002_19_P3]|nr:MAG: hypothetical protein B0D92_08585 [Spirochaeta sp. LUC14_002_19_P3]
MNDTDKNSFLDNGLQFECISCGHCCRHESGYVFLSEKDINGLAAYQHLSAEIFTKQYCRMVNIGTDIRVSLLETSDNDCIFWNQKCTVYEARPHQCRTYPFWPSIVSSKEQWCREGCDCPGIGRGKNYSREEIHRILEEIKRNKLISCGK